MPTRNAEPRIAVLAAAAVMAACQHTAPAPTPAPPQQVEVGSTFTLLAPLTFPAGRAELLFQGQRQLKADALMRNAPYCKLTPLAGVPHTLAPQSFKVANVTYEGRESGDTSEMFSIIRIALASGADRPAFTMSCGWPAATSAPAFLTTEQIYSAIGGQFSMQLSR